ncbi:MAG: hypothetical protein IKA62_02145 [Clostridia bacterium]|nr:hypothetical protein [Clostridia bacterium]
MAYKKKSKIYRRRKKFSYSDRFSYYGKKAEYGKTAKEQDYAMGYLDGMRGVRGNIAGTDAGEAGNEAGLRFWSKLKSIKI